MNEMQDFFNKKNQNAKDVNMEILRRALNNLEALKSLQKKLNQGGSSASIGLYKWYNMSFKVFYLQPKIKEIYTILRSIASDELSTAYVELVTEALKKKFINSGKAFSYGADGFDEGVPTESECTNDNWLSSTSSIILAYLVSEKILDALINLCDKSEITDKDLLEAAFTELIVLFRTY